MIALYSASSIRCYFTVLDNARYYRIYGLTRHKEDEIEYRSGKSEARKACNDAKAFRLNYHIAQRLP